MQPTQPSAHTNSALARFIDNLVEGIARHWLTIFNVLWGLYVLLPLAAPLLMALGFTSTARVIYSVYSFACHQLPDHSYFFFGDHYHFTPSIAQLEAGGLPTALTFFEQRLFIGNELTGYKAAICQRDTAIYGAVFLSGLFYRYWNLKGTPLNWRIYALFILPMAIDGGTQLLGMRESNWWLRSLTGILFGIGSVWFAYPHIQAAMEEVEVKG